MVPEPFLLIGLIAGIRCEPLLTAEMAQVQPKSNEVLRRSYRQSLMLRSRSALAIIETELKLIAAPASIGRKLRSWRFIRAAHF